VTPPDRGGHAAADILAAVVAGKAGGENRPGQEAMCAAVDAALGRKSRKLLGDASTDTDLSRSTTG